MKNLSIGQVVTFYSYKGGTGRTMALANIAALLSEQKKVLIIDWDLDAPGLHYFFNLSGPFENPGLIDYFEEVERIFGTHPEWNNEDNAGDLFSTLNLDRYIQNVANNNLFLLAAGRLDDNYAHQVNVFQWEALFYRAPWFFRVFARELSQQYDYILIDSRTGLNDISGICTALLPDKMVAVFTPSLQSIRGISSVIKNALKYRSASEDLRVLSVFPLPSRIEQQEQELFAQWRFGSGGDGFEGYEASFESLFVEIYGLKKCKLGKYFNDSLIQQTTYYAYGEKIAVMEPPAFGRLSLKSSYEVFANKLINSAAPWMDTKDESLVPSYIYDVFISYSKEQYRIASVIAESLRNAGIGAFFNHLDAVNDEIIENLSASKDILCLISEPWLVKEWEFVKANLAPSQRVIPVRCGETILPTEFASQPRIIDLRSLNPGDLLFDYNIAQLPNLIDPSLPHPGDLQVYASSRAPEVRKPAKRLTFLENNVTKTVPKVFISYSWDDDSHREWARKFATRLRKDGIETVLDRWYAVPGDQLDKFMEEAVRESDFILCICTPMYKEKSDQRGEGIGYEGDVMTSEVFVNRNQRKFIPVLRKGEWKQSAPSWMLGKYYIDLRGDPYNEQSYRDLLATLHNERDEVPSVEFQENDDYFEFVNREIELATLDPAKLINSYWQCALISAPSGYGKTTLLKRLITNIQHDPILYEKWSCCYVNLLDCEDLENAILFIAEEITGEKFVDNIDDGQIKDRICDYILNKLSAPVTTVGALRNVLFIVDTIDRLPLSYVKWFSSVIHDIVTGSYIDYERGVVSFSVRIILSGVDIDAFWQTYLNWEVASEKYMLRPAMRLYLSPFNELVVTELIRRRAVKEGVLLGIASISDIAYELQYLTSGHPQVVAEILNELASKKFRMYKEYLRNNRYLIIKNYISVVAKKTLRRFPLLQAQRDIKTICVFRLIDLNTLQRLRVENLVSSQVDIKLLGQLCENKILAPPNAEKLFYHNDIIRRILYLDMSFGDDRDDAHVQSTHRCAKSLYREWIENNRHSFHFFFVEWLFHSLQITDLSNKDIVSEWKSLMLLIHSTFLPLEDFKRAVDEKLKSDYEVRYLFRERFGPGDFSLLLET